jgi:predicted  nucleic acid-binding Zn-ribbon protein
VVVPLLRPVAPPPNQPVMHATVQCRAVDEDWGKKCTAQQAREAADFREQLQRHKVELKQARKRAAEHEQRLSQLSKQRDTELLAHQVSAKG